MKQTIFASIRSSQKGCVWGLVAVVLGSSFLPVAAGEPAQNKPVPAVGKATYLVDSATGDDTNPAGKPLKTLGRLNAVKLALGDTVLISPGTQEETLMPSGEGTAENPVTIKFLPGVHTISVNKVQRKKPLISNSIDFTEPIPVGIIMSGVKHFCVQGGGVQRTDATVPAAATQKSKVDFVSLSFYGLFPVNKIS